MDYHLGSKKLRVEHYITGKQLILLSKISFFVNNLIKVTDVSSGDAIR